MRCTDCKQRGILVKIGEVYLCGQCRPVRGVKVKHVRLTDRDIERALRGRLVEQRA